MCVPGSSFLRGDSVANPALAWRGWLFSDQPGETDSDTQGLGGVRVVLSVTSCSDAHPYPALEWTGLSAHTSSCRTNAVYATLCNLKICGPPLYVGQIIQGADTSPSPGVTSYKYYGRGDPTMPAVCLRLTSMCQTMAFDLEFFGLLFF